MQKLTFLFAFLLFLSSCSEEMTIQDSTSNNTIENVTPSTTIHPSITSSSWWNGLPEFTRALHTVELTSEKESITFKELQNIKREKIEAVRNLTGNVRGPKVSPGYPTPNPEGDVTLTSQADVDAFGAFKFKEITGFLNIDDTDSPDPICDLSPLSKLKEVGSYLIISASCVTNLDGLSKIKSVGKLGPFGYIAVRCENVTDINGISGIKTITGSINIINNINLTSLGSAFSNITAVESGKTTATLTSFYVLNMSGNIALTDLGGLGNLTKVERNFLFSGNDALTDLDGFTALNFIGNFISIADNASLQNVNKLSVITNITNGLLVQDNPSLTDCCGLYNLLCSNPPLCDIPGAAAGYIILNNGAGCTAIDIITNGPC
ncbi:MAG: hypothetical protein HKN68_13140 [Saprospiraceae bacterium]|nr:hypothetical protein [Saprospiraceae bacterium]